MKHQRSYHLDASYLFPLLFPSLEEKDNYRTAQDSIHKLQNRGYLLRISDVAAGELVRKGIEKRRSSAGSSDFFATLKELGVEVYSLRREEVGRFSELLNFLRSPHREVGGKPAGDPIRPPDSLIVAYSMADRESFGLLTFDTDLLFSRRVAAVVGERMKNKKGLE
jgi:hypothetical protein